MPACATDHLQFGPDPAWVKVMPLPIEDGAPGSGIVRRVLRNNQVAFEPDGTTALYWDAATKVLAPDGLAKVANIALPWNPDTDTLTVHRLHIVRAGQVIDVLKTQQFTVLRREKDLERASIDGTLTASLQIAGLQVGDVVELAATIRRRDPALAGHHDERLRFLPTTMSANLDAHWPATLDMHWRTFPGLPDPQMTGTRDAVTLSLPVSHLAEPDLPKGAPPRFLQADVIQFSDWKDWADLSATMAALFDRAATPVPGGAVTAEAARIAAATRDPVARAEAALALVQDQVRYLFVGLNDGGLVPAPADQTWQRRYGDCKGKTALLLALLHTLGIAAQPVLVNASGLGDAIPRYLPAAGLFNHVLVRATIGGREYWLDGTRTGDRRLADIVTPPFRWGLPLQHAGAALVPMMPPPLARPTALVSVAIDASGGLDRPAPTHAEILLHGDEAVGMARRLDAAAPEQRDQILRQLWHTNADYLAPTRVAARFDPIAREETLSADGTATLDWVDGALELTGMQFHGSSDLARRPGPAADAPYAIMFPHYFAHKEAIKLPDGGRGFVLDPIAIDQTIAGRVFQRAGQIKDGVAQLEVSMRTIAPEFPATEAAAILQEERRLAHQHVYLRDTRAAVKPTL